MEVTVGRKTSYETRREAQAVRVECCVLRCVHKAVQSLRPDVTELFVCGSARLRAILAQPSSPMGIV